jgi:hypothetical protein
MLHALKYKFVVELVNEEVIVFKTASSLFHSGDRQWNLQLFNVIMCVLYPPLQRLSQLMYKTEPAGSFRIICNLRITFLVLIR